MPRFYCPGPLLAGQAIELAEGPARHVQVLRLQPGAPIVLFNGEGGEYEAVVEHTGRSQVRVEIGAHRAIERETDRQVHLAVGMPANERMDWLVEKATELGAASIQPLVAQRSVLKLNSERADRKRAHWQAICIAGCEQSGRNRIPQVHTVMDFPAWLAMLPANRVRVLLSLAPTADSLARAAAGSMPVLVLSGPEGGLTPPEENAALAQGFAAANLGQRVLRSETAPLAALAALTLG